MSRQRVTYKIIDGRRCKVTDIGVDDFERAEYNRFIVKHKMFTTFYEMVERFFAHTPLGKALPDWMPRGELAQIAGDRRTMKELENKGFSEETQA